MELNIEYTNKQLERILDQAVIYMCACPSQVAEQVIRLRNLFAYQKNCMIGDETALSIKTHQLIADATRQTHDVMQTCLHDVLVHENWDLETLEMPANLRELLEKTILK